MDTYDNMTNNVAIHGQAHHVNQDAAYKSKIPHDDGICVELYGNAFKDIRSWHYKAHQSLEKFWNIYRKGGAKEGKIPTNGQYLRALYDSMVFAGFTRDNAAYIEYRAYEQQKSYKLKITDKVPKVPGRLNQAK